MTKTDKGLSKKYTPRYVVRKLISMTCQRRDKNKKTRQKTNRLRRRVISLFGVVTTTSSLFIYYKYVSTDSGL